jgi:DNA polymerase III subunit chi
MEKNSLPSIAFYRVKDNLAKIQLICGKAQEAFAQEKRLLIAVQTFEAAQYVEALLWRIPPESFIPHTISDTTTSEWIAITMQDQLNVNHAPRLLNLCPTASALYQAVEEVYELYDESHPQKIELSQKRARFYQEKGLLVKHE